ncbi:uncharacterized protein LOC105185458 [Harpegnathos saltator]|uniref:DUF4780 domain-containing protein n=1 Tax=Harpegnathos saltator TaxID=610380 RepID=E2B2I5_HARSA|nr:uncharacterized protein LOC105185458 [Harpegnathos saltator]EFN90100.1 hypothetical protein EAI_16094 [Harpegnathos saltator]
MQSGQKDSKSNSSATLPSMAASYGARAEMRETNRLGQKSSESQTRLPAKRRRVRMSGAARRRRKKQREAMKEAERTAFLALSASISGGLATAARNVSTAGPSLKYARNREMDEYSPDAPPVKRLKIDDEKPHDQATSDLREIAVVPVDYPDKKLDANEVALIRRLIKLRILGLANGTKTPTFKAAWEWEGTLIFGCNDEHTRDWLKSFMSEIIVKEKVPVRALPADELFGRHHVVVHVEDPEMSVKESLEFLHRQNKELLVNEWVIACRKSRDAVRSHFSALVSGRSLKVLEGLSFKPFCGLSQVTVKLLKKERMKEDPGYVAES